MSDLNGGHYVFDGEVKINEIGYDDFTQANENNDGFFVLEDDRYWCLSNEEHAKEIAYRVNTHDQLTQSLADTKCQLHSLFERVSGCSVSECKDDQLDYLADYIEGQMDATEGALDKCKKDLAAAQKEIAELRESLVNMTMILENRPDGFYLEVFQKAEIEDAKQLLAKGE